MATGVIINGGIPLTGTIDIEANKNAVLPSLCAAVRSKYDCILRNIPKSPDVEKLLQAIKELGGKYNWDAAGTTVTVNCKNLQSKPVGDCVNSIQSAILFAGPLLARFGEADIPVSIGCKLGYRGPEDHIYYLSKLGVECKVENGRIRFSVDLKNVQTQDLVQVTTESTMHTYIFSEASVTPTENLLMMLSAVTKFNVKVIGIASEPHVQCLIEVLKQMGANIDGHGNTLIARGNKGEMKGFDVDFKLQPDHVDLYGTAVMVALTRGDVFLKCMPTPVIQFMVEFLRNVGVVCKVEQTGVMIKGSESSYSPSQGLSRANANTWKINPMPWPGFPVDCLPSCVVWTCANLQKGTATTLNNWMYEDGIQYSLQLKMLGASIKVIKTDYGAQKVIVKGTGGKNYFDKFKNRGITIEGVPVIEGVRALISAALSRKGKTTIEDISPILRRNPEIIKKLKELGADIEIL
jgi:UDP-N-acetylglucosamine 1-carboxyvinyltransferase